jgi:Zn-finger nucleic acid-binding protein
MTKYEAQYFKIMESLSYFKHVNAKIERKTGTDMEYNRNMDDKLFERRLCPICKTLILDTNKVDKFIYSTPHYEDETFRVFAHTLCVKQLADMMRIKSMYSRHKKENYPFSIRSRRKSDARRRQSEA